jgi:cytochrome P450
LIEACLKETLRKYSVVPIAARRVVQDLYLPKHRPQNILPDDPKGQSQQTVEMEGTQEEHYFLPKGSTVLINIQAVHLDPNIWPEPMKYDPYRFLYVQPQTVGNNNGSSDNRNDAALKKSSSTSLKDIEPYTFLPFIAGPRNCLGQHLALLETKMVMALLFQRYDFTLPDDIRIPSSTNVNTDSNKNFATSWRDATIIDPRHRYMVPIIPKKEIMLRVSRKKGTNQLAQH